MTITEARPPATEAPSSRTRIRSAALSLVVIVAIFGLALPAFADYGDVWDTITAMTWLEVASLTALAAFNLWTYLPLLTSVLPGLRQRQAFVVNNSSTAISNTMPGGGALGVGVTYSLYRSWGFSNTAISLSVVVSGIWNTFVKLGLPIVALALLAIAGEATAALIAASLVGVVILLGAIIVFGLVLRSEGFARSMGERAQRLTAPVLRLTHRPPASTWGDGAVGFRTSVTELVERRWARITVATVVSHMTLFVILLVALRHVGVDNDTVGWTTVLAAFAFGRLITAIPITPGGLGVIELGYVAALSVGATAEVETRIVAAVLLFRAITFVPPILIGGCTYLFWRRNTSWRVTQPDPLRDPAAAGVTA